MTIDFEPTDSQSFGVSFDLREQFPSSEPWREHLRAMEVIAYPSLFHIHLKPATPEGAKRIAKLEQAPHLLPLAVQGPELVHGEPEYNEGHWIQAYAVENPGNAGHFVVVVVSLANLEGEESAHHKVVTVFPAKRRNVFRTTEDGRVVPRDKWVLVEKKRTG
jgi:hypothetical protein